MSNLLDNLDLSDLKNVQYLMDLKKGFNHELAEFHSKVRPPAKNGQASFRTKKGGTKSYTYVQLEDLIKAVDTALSGTGMTWRQDSEVRGGVIRVRTSILASNGYEYVSPWIEIKTSDSPQDIGSGITYAKRYSLSASFGINSETDDDGKQAQVASTGNNNSRTYKQTSQPNPQPSRPQATKAKPQSNNPDPLISQPQLRLVNDKLTKLSQAKGTNADDEAQRYLAMVHLTKLEDLTSSQAVLLVNHLDKDIKQAEANKPQQQKSDDLDRWLENRGVTTNV
ncbi:ERF family protein [Pediococcus acidilactici]|uniref:ERF family protein n=1 Tax=Pediococcus acidilactici TaxID=1254 RepID=A0AAW8YLV2_PEDAC|nr:ERF family protein [Pediococcus acidilactici]MDV2911438.1 ERF family protein [Pediococcus acidilactici]WQS17209.1 ERF family protein [Pediococcus acidilactici]